MGYEGYTGAVDSSEDAAGAWGAYSVDSSQKVDVLGKILS